MKGTINKMNIKRYNYIYKLKIIDWVKVKFYQNILLLKRIKRQLHVIKKHFKATIIATILLFIYILTIYFIGVKTIYFNSFYDAIWDARELIFSFLVLSIFIPYYDAVKKRKIQLKRQYYDYTELYIKCDYIMYLIINGFTKINYNYIFISTEKNKKFKNNFFKRKYKTFHIEQDKKYEIISWLDSLNITIYKIIENLKYNKYIGVDNTYGDNIEIGEFNFMLNAITKLKEALLSSENTYELIKSLREFNKYSIYCIDMIRRPWRWDYKINMKINKIIKKYTNSENINDPINIWF